MENYISSLLAKWRIGLINFLFKGTNIMATIEEVQAKVVAQGEALTIVNSTLDAMDVKLDEIRNFIAGLQVGSVVTQEQLDALNASLDTVGAIVADSQTKVAAVLAEADALDEPSA